jgi:transcriptional regulator with XRE-family HTH domain
MRSRGSVEFARMPGGVLAKAERYGVGKSTISNWQRGESTPDGAKRERIFEAGGPDPSAWDEVWAPPAGDTQLPEDEPTEATAEDTAGVAAGLLVEIRKLQRELAAPGATADMSIAERVRMVDALAGAADKLGKHTGIKLTTRQILASPLWGEVMTALTQALKPWPDAMRAVADSLDTLKA